jgi:hypothetical protein
MQELQGPPPQSFAPSPYDPSYDPYTHSIYSFTSDHPSNYEYLPNIRNSLPITSYHQFTIPINYTLSGNLLPDFNNNSGQTNSF